MASQILALALCRVSSAEQLENNSLNRQRESVLREAQKRNVVIPENGWWEGSVSSKKGTNIGRKDLQEILERCRKDKRIKYLIVDELDRFMRSMLEIGHFLVEFQKLGVQVIFASQPGLKTDTAADTLMLMLEAYKAEGSNEERQRKSIAGQAAALREGRYPFSPKPGYTRGYERGIQEIDPVRGPVLREVLLDIAEKRLSPAQALVKLNKSDFMNGHAPYKMDKFRSIVTDPFYAGIVEIKQQVNVRNENGLHEPIISKAQHYELVRIMNDKRKNQSGPKKNGNPKYPLNTIVCCANCIDAKNGKIVGFDHSNGRPNGPTYEKYRCRACGQYWTREALHHSMQQLLHGVSLTSEGLDDILEALEQVWKQESDQYEQEATRIKHKLSVLRQGIQQQVEAATDPSNASIKGYILDAIDKKKAEVSELEAQLAGLQSAASDDKERFLRFAFDFIKNMGGNFLAIDREDRERCKQIIFPGGLYVVSSGKVYTTEMSPLYRLATIKKGAVAPQSSHLVRVTGL